VGQLGPFALDHLAHLVRDTADVLNLKHVFTKGRHSILARHSVALLRFAALCQPRIPKDRKERRASAVRERIVASLAIVDDESLDRHGLHCVRGDANGGMADAGCGAEQDHALFCGELRRHLCHGYSLRQLLANAVIAASRVAQ